ncbi:sensor histidine kinase [Flavobacterium pallidum]|uniref:histidine kinase n=1 Tax=Flavobacterium pallidum TaxID=2172098 RepID=A0A2S1SDG7_9FLAO|nr:two-component regulator propeller domain-containing protein [Flavobacterium pallidum]AWI24431.1 hypothetical protein HYN49_00175 [Flavobacterium pallidum]
MASLAKSFTLFILLFFASAVWPQSGSQISWSTDSESLPQNSIKSIAPDKYGFIWMTTENGLVRYDGRDFKIFDSGNTGIKNNRITYLRGSLKKDSIYTSTENTEDIILINHRRALKVDPKKHKAPWFDDPGKNNLLICEGIPSYFFGLPKRPYKIPLPGGDYYSIANDSVAHYDNKKNLLYKIKFHYEANKYFFVLGQKLFYLAPDGKYAAITERTVSSSQLKIKPGNDFQIYWNIVSEQVFLYSNENLYQLHADSGKLSEGLLIEKQDLKSANVWTIYFDSGSGIIYLGSIKKGLGIYKIKSFKTITPDKNHHPELFEIFYAIHPYNDSTAISSSGIFMDGNEIIRNLEFYTDKYDVAIDQNGDIWTSYFSLLHRYKKSDGFKKMEEWDFIDDISTIYVAKNGTIWMDLAKRRKNFGKLYHFKPDQKPEFIKQADLNTKINCITEDANGKIWLGTKNGLYFMDSVSGKPIAVAGSGNIKVRSIYFDSDQNLWFTSYEKGFLLYRNNKIYRFPTDKNGYLNASHCILEDHKGFFWISTNKGLFQVKRKSLLDYASSKMHAVYYQYYDKSFGFLTNEFNGGCQPCGTRLANGNFLFPSLNGVVVFNPDKISPILPNKNIFIDEIIVDEKNITTGKSIELNRNFERITFVVSSPYFGNQSNLNFEARLEGPDNQDWMAIKDHRSITFTKLRPGTYTLTIRKLNGFDSRYDYTKIKIIVPEAFWQTAWFQFLMITLIVLLIYAGYNFRLKFIRKRNILLEKTINDQTHDLKNTISTLRATKDSLHEQAEKTTKLMQYITHDIKTPLKFMSMASQMMYESDNSNPEELKENLKSIFTSSTQMYNFIDNLLEYTKAYTNNEVDTEEFSLYRIVEEKIALFQGIAQSQKTSIRNLIMKDTALVTNRQLFSIIIHNILDNAVKYTGNGSIIISAVSSPEKLEIVVKDTGVGMSEKTKRHYTALMENYENNESKKSAKLGLYIVIESLLILNGTIEFTSKENRGTTIRMSFRKIKP